MYGVWNAQHYILMQEQEQNHNNNTNLTQSEKILLGAQQVSNIVYSENWFYY